MEIGVVIFAVRVVSIAIKATVMIVSVLGSKADPLPDRLPVIPVERPEYVQAEESYQRNVPPISVEQGVKDATVRIRVDIERRNPLTGAVEKRAVYGSGVCIDPRGYVLTVRHIVSHQGFQLPEKAVVKFGGDIGEVTAIILPVKTGGSDAPVLLKCDESAQYPFAPLAMSSPIENVNIFCSAYHAGNYVNLKGMVVGHTLEQKYRDPNPLVSPMVDAYGNPMYVFSFAAMGGMSGGPISNQDGNVFSLFVSTDTQQSFGISIKSCVDCASQIPTLKVHEYQQGKKPVIEIWSIKDIDPSAPGIQPCKFCLLLDAAFEDPQFAKLVEDRYEIEWYYVDESPKHARAAASRGLSAWPSTYIKDKKEIIEGFPGKDLWLKEIGIDVSSNVEIEAEPRKKSIGGSSSSTATTAVEDEAVEVDSPPAGSVTVQAEPKADEPVGLFGRLSALFFSVIATILTLLSSVAYNFWSKWRQHVKKMPFIKRRIALKVEREVLSKVRAAVDPHLAKVGVSFDQLVAQTVPQQASNTGTLLGSFAPQTEEAAADVADDDDWF